MKSVSIIIPCYNEEESLPQLFTKLTDLERRMSGFYQPTFIFVDDGSKDRTFTVLNEQRDVLQSVKIIQHEENKNLGAALKTGIENSTQVDYLVFLDSDCTYEPIVILDLLKKLEEGDDVCTVSPYHPAGRVQGVPEWRLFLSRGLSAIYRLILGTNLFTYTAMVRAIKYDKIFSILSARNDFSFVTELLINAIRCRLKISEVPTTLKVREFGVSKMNVLKTIRSHLSIIWNLL